MTLDALELEPCEQPEEQNFQLADGIFIKAGLFKKEQTVIPQHSHEYDHTSFIATGAVDAWADDEYLGRFDAPAAIFIAAKRKHTFVTLKPDTQIFCIHNISRNGQIDIHDLHELHFP